MECLKNVVGFSKTESTCFTGEFSQEAKTSDSGLFIDALPETQHILRAVKGTADSGQKMNDIFSNARQFAINAFKEKVFEELGIRYSVRTLPYNGLIGQHSINQPLNLTTNLFGASFEMRPMSGGLFTIRKIYLALTQTGIFTVNIYRATAAGMFYQPQLIKSIQANAVAAQVAATVLEEPLELPLVDDSNNVLHYLFLIDRSLSGVQPMDNKADCGCGTQQVVSKWLVQGGISGNDINSLQPSLRTLGSTGHINGITVEGSIRCEEEGIICNSYYNNPFVRTAIQHAINFEAGANLLKGILRSNAVDRYALTKREQMAADAAKLHNQFKNRIQWIAENIDLGPNSCFICNDNGGSGIYTTNIRF